MGRKRSVNAKPLTVASENLVLLKLATTFGL
jgi:hypothetical protein